MRFSNSRSLFGVALALAIAAPAFAADAPLKGVDLSAMDKSAAPGDDFYRYANGAWLTRTQIPADQSAWGAFNALNEISRQRTRSLIEDAIKTKAAGEAG